MNPPPPFPPPPLVLAMSSASLCFRSLFHLQLACTRMHMARHHYVTPQQTDWECLEGERAQEQARCCEAGSEVWHRGLGQLADRNKPHVPAPCACMLLFVRQCSTLVALSDLLLTNTAPPLAQNIRCSGLVHVAGMPLRELHIPLGCSSIWFHGANADVAPWGAPAAKCGQVQPGATAPSCALPLLSIHWCRDACYIL